MPDASAKQPVIVKKYANRRLYNTETSTYITLDHLSAMTRDGRDFQVLDAKTGDDITRGVLAQIIMDEETRGATMLPVGFLRQLITLYGDQMQAMVPHYLDAAMDAFRRNQEQFREAVVGAMGGVGVPGATPATPAIPVNPFEAMARQNMAMMKAAAEMWTRTARPGAPKPAEEPAAPAASVELDALKSQVAALQAQLEKLSRG